MAIRPIFIPLIDKSPYVKEVNVEFKWFPGFAKSQAQKSIESLHAAAAKQGISPVLEISSQSPDDHGVALSAFNLKLHPQNHPNLSVECAFQGSKVFANGKQYTDLYDVSSKEAKKDPRLHNSGDVVAFICFGIEFPTHPITVFYDWLYLLALKQNKTIAQQLLSYQGFSDIKFNPKKSFNCQARSAALFVALTNNGLIEETWEDKDTFLRIVTSVNNDVSGSIEATQSDYFGKI